MEDAGQLWAITNGNSPQSMKVAREGVRLLYCLQHSGLLLRTSAQEMAAIRLQSKNRRIAADSISIVGNVLSIIGIFVPPLLFLGIGASIPASAYRIKKDADHRCMERKAKHEVLYRMSA